MVQSRRSALQLGGVTLIGVLGGCTGSPVADGSTEQATSEPTRTSRSPVTNATRGGGGVRSWVVPLNLESSGGPFVSFTVGDPESLPSDVYPHYVVVENQGDSEREIAIRVQDRRATTAAINTEIQFPSLGIAQIEIATPATYDVAITASGKTANLTVAQSTFDCNDSATGVYVRSGGEIEHASVTTEMACHTETEH